MTKAPQELDATGEVELLADEPLAMDAEAVLRDFVHHYAHSLGRRTVRARSPFAYRAMVQLVRDRLMERWNQTLIAREVSDTRRTCYLSLEFLMGRLLNNALLNLDLQEPAREAMANLGLDLEQLRDSERDAGLGNGGLGRLAACFLDSCATLALPVVGYGLRYHYGMFHQSIDNGHQVEQPDPWLRDGFPWEIERSELAQTVRFGGRTEPFRDAAGQLAYRWVDTRDVLAVPFDIPIPGFRNGIVNTLRLWSAEATDAFNLEEFNAGSYADAVAGKNEAENITMVLYPNAASENGRELRLRQQYLLASASLQDTLRDWDEQHPDLSDFAKGHCFQLNDTHPAVAVAELMRLLMDERGLTWDDAWAITTATMAYTNHTLLPEALEQWPVSLFRHLLPRVLEIIFEINARFLGEVDRKWPGDNHRLQQMSLIDEGHEPMVRMAYLAIVGSFSVNGVAELHSRLLREGLFSNFNAIWPEKFNNKTNGVTHRRWLVACNPALTELITATIGDGWIRQPDQLTQLSEYAENSEFQKRWRTLRQHNKSQLVELIERRTQIRLSEQMLFDVQVKRIHEYKRQLLNLLHAIHLYDRINRGDGKKLVPRAIIIGGKAAPGYDMAKSIVKAINNVAAVINGDPRMHDQLRLVFFPDYNVSAMEVICPAADLSEQISTAGKEASGTGNMKFMMNGAVTIGTLDGANVEIRDAAGADNFFLFGLTVEQVAAQRGNYDPQHVIRSDPDLSNVMGLLRSGHFNRFEPGVLDPIIAAVEDPGDPWMTAADFRAFVDAQRRVEKAFVDKSRWTAMSIVNAASSGQFSTDRTIADYNADIWHLPPTRLPAN